VVETQLSATMNMRLKHLELMASLLALLPSHATATVRCANLSCTSVAPRGEFSHAKASTSLGGSIACSGRKCLALSTPPRLFEPHA
jgi:hypothetical protein